MSRLAAVSRRTAISLLACVIALIAAGCGSSDEGTIPPGDADQLISLLDATQSDLQSGSCDLIAGHASEFAADVASLPDSVDQSVRDELSKAAKNLTALAKNPDQCGGASGASGAQGVESTSSTTSTTSETVETSPPESSSSTREDDDDRGAALEQRQRRRPGQQRGRSGPGAARPAALAASRASRAASGSAGGQPGRRSDWRSAGVRRARSRRQGGDPVNSTISDRYELGDRLGSGGMSTVYRATDRVLERTVAVKILAEHLSDDDKFVARFRREALAVAKLIHPNIVQVYDTGVDAGPPLHRHGVRRGQVGRPAAADPRTARARRRRSRSGSRPAPGSSTPTARGSSTATSSPGT